ncbi:hypothetical protein DFH27DRAFT_575044 [Peziza echinospora]|nr:hypothetical protein DFH27DRAFT_575044 [Peziza echinospora]
MTGPGPLRPACLGSCKLFSAAPTRSISSGNAVRLSSTTASSTASASTNTRQTPISTHGGTVTTATYIIPPPHLPGEYGEYVGRKRKQLLHFWQLQQFARRRDTPRTTVPGAPRGKRNSNDRPMLDMKQGRFYELEPVDRLRDVLSHDIPIDYHWPEDRGTWGDWNRGIDMQEELSVTGALVGNITPAAAQKKRVQDGQEISKHLDELRQLIADDKPAKDIYYWALKTSKDKHAKITIISYALWSCMVDKNWNLMVSLAEVVSEDMKMNPNIRDSIMNRFFVNLVHKKSELPQEVIDNALKLIKRPFSNEALMFMLDHNTLVKHTLRLYIADHKLLPDIKVTNKAFSMAMEQFEDSEEWQRQPDQFKRPWRYWKARNELYRTFTGYFDHDRVNTESIRLLLKYACDRDEVKRILRIVLQANDRDPSILRKTQHQFIESLRRFEIKLEDIEASEGNHNIPLRSQHAAENLAELLSFEQLLKKRGVALSRASLVSLISASAIHGSSTNLQRLIRKFLSASRSFQPRELRDLLRELLPNEHGADLLTQRHRIVGNRGTWAKHQQKHILLNHLRQFVGDDQRNLANYIRALGRCGDAEAIWAEWVELRNKDFKMNTEAEKVKDGTLAVFVSALGMTGDSRLAQICFTEAKQLAGARTTPTIIAGLMARHPSRTGAERNILSVVAGEDTEWHKVLGKMLDSQVCPGWSMDELIVAQRVLKEVGTYNYYVKQGVDLKWAEKAVVGLLKSREGLEKGCVSKRVRWPQPAQPLPKLVKT